MPGPGYTSPSSKRGKNMIREFARAIYDKGNLPRKPTERELARAMRKTGKLQLRRRP